VKGVERTSRKTAGLAFAFPFNPGELGIGWTDFPLSSLGESCAGVRVFGVSHHCPNIVQGADELGALVGFVSARLEVRVVEVQCGFAQPSSELFVGDEGTPRVVAVRGVDDLG
jgi:hypothetical protein